MTGISTASSSVATGSSGLWQKTKSSLENVGKSMFEQPQQDYSLSAYGVPPPPGQQGMIF